VTMSLVALKDVWFLLSNKRISHHDIYSAIAHKRGAILLFYHC